jgi:hypothetical protein
LLTRVDSTIAAPQPLTIEQVRAGELGPQSRAAQALDGLAIQGVGSLPVAEQGARPCPNPVGPVVVGDRGGGDDTVERAGCLL